MSSLHQVLSTHVHGGLSVRMLIRCMLLEYKVCSLNSRPCLSKKQQVAGVERIHFDIQNRFNLV